MSVPVPLEELPEQIERFGPHAYIVTVGAEGRPRATSVSVFWHEALLKVAAGRRTAANVSGNDQVALLWPAPEPGEHALLVDGLGAVHDSPGEGPTVLVQPAKAVLHVTTPARV
ncbi:MAG: pyridoxamine 5'-phosphate oxidase family protein [Solirubrobacteraceae bacterium]